MDLVKLNTSLKQLTLTVVLTWEIKPGLLCESPGFDPPVLLDILCCSLYSVYPYEVEVVVSVTKKRKNSPNE